MSDGPSVLSLAAAGLYAIVVIACLIALARTRRIGHPVWHARSWAVLALLFIFLLSMRVTGIEETLRDSVRAVLRAEGAFEERRDFQRIVVGALFLIGAAGGFWLFYKASKGAKQRLDRVVQVAVGAGLVMGGLIALRLVSLHSIDRLLYGALKLNWVTDIGTSLTILGAGAYYVWLTQALGNAPRR